MAWYDPTSWGSDTWKRIGTGVATGGLSEGYRYLQDQASKGYDTAAAGARDISQQGQAFSEEQWRRQMEGLDKAQSAYGPSQQAWYSMYGSQGPGAMENWWTQNQSRFGQEGAQQGAYNSYQNWMNQPGYAQQGYAQAGQSLAGSNNSAGAYGAMGQGLQNYQGPQYGRDAFNFSQGDYQKAGTGENFYGQNANRYNQETNSQATYEYLGQQLKNQSRMDDFSRNVLGKMSEAELADKLALMKHQGFAQGPTALQLNEGENKGYIRGADQLANYYGSQLGALQGPGAYEDFVTSDIYGRNPAFERQREQGIQSINHEMARRGAFNSGGALTAIGNYTGALDAADYQNRSQRAQQAQQMQLARIGQGLQGAQATSALDVQRGGALGQLDTASEQAQLGRQNFGLAAEKEQREAEMARHRLQFDMAQAGDADQLARNDALSRLSGQADTANLGLLNAGQHASASAQDQMLQRLMGYQNSANSVDQTRLASDNQALQRMLGSFNMAQGADQTAMARAQQQYGMGLGMDQFNMSKYAQQQNAAQGLDQYNLASLMGGGAMAGNAQNAQQQRMQQAFASLFGLNNAQAGQYGQFYGQGGQLSGQAFADAMNALMASYGYKAQGQNAEAAVPWKLANLAVDAKKATG